MKFPSLADLLPALCLLAASPVCVTASAKDTSLSFSEYYELEPFKVVGEEIPITVFARNSGDRRYATNFAHDVVEVVYDTIEKSPGSGLVIIGRSGEPHPITILERFLEIAGSEDASPDQKAIADELEKALANWRDKIQFDAGDEDEDFPIDMASLIDAFPIPLPKIAADLYLLAWKENFELERVDVKLKNLSSSDLRKDEFEEFKWVFYLPPRNALNKVLKEVLPAIFKAEEIGPMKRILIRGALATFKPIIRDAMEGVRKGVLYWSVLNVNQDALHEGDIEPLVEAYFESQMPRGKIIGGGKKDRAIEAIREQKIKNDEYAKDPFTIPDPLEKFEPSAYAALQGNYGASDHRNKRFFIEDERIYWQEGDDDPVMYLPAGDQIFVSIEKDITLEFARDEFGQYSSVELRKGRDRWTFQRFPDVPLDL